jgi:hypothetical protein
MSAYDICVKNVLKCVLSVKYYWHNRNDMLLGKGDERRPQGRGRFTLQDSIEVDVKEIM